MTALGAQRLSSRLQAGELEQILNQAAQSAGFQANRIKITGECLLVPDGIVLDRLHEGLNRRHRRSQIVRNVLHQLFP